jgi:hypothetical protein
MEKAVNKAGKRFILFRRRIINAGARNAAGGKIHFGDKRMNKAVVIKAGTKNFREVIFMLPK